jgi:hypothetical protein
MADVQAHRWVAFYRGERDLRHGLSILRGAPLAVEEVYGPYPLHWIDEALGRKRSRLPWVCLAAGVGGGLSALLFQFYAAVVDWPVNVGGKPANSTLAFIPITFELTVLAAALVTAAAFLMRSRLFPRPSRPSRWPEVTHNRFAVVGIVEPEARSRARVEQIFYEAGAESVRPVEEP